MIGSVIFCSLDSFKNHLKPSIGTIAISILAQDEWESAKRLPVGFAGHIKLCFDDVYEEMFNQPQSLTEFTQLNKVEYPDLHANHEEGVRLFHKKYELCDLNDAKKIVKFLQHYSSKPEQFELVVHCYAGISRSSAVAQFVADRFGSPIVGQNQETSFANKRLLRLLNKAINE